MVEKTETLWSPGREKRDKIFHSSLLWKINNKEGDPTSPDSQCCWFFAFFQSRTKCDLGTTLKAELFQVMQHRNQNIGHLICQKRGRRGVLFLAVLKAKHEETVIALAHIGYQKVIARG
ncbi:hypothetical protein AAES_123007 [Amazona aestiva]|uniref:Uncharacterized protein n=1 Tax=Amazona aestiva TaxID=12930 RepID=A0A0Q3UR78_AMAAE|nr:hypothetical protein AAES_123007 [Amazona aestiva]